MTTHSLDDSDEEELYFDLVGSHHSGSSVHSMESSFSSTTTGKSTSTLHSKFYGVKRILRLLCLQCNITRMFKIWPHFFISCETPRYQGQMRVLQHGC